MSSGVNFGYIKGEYKNSILISITYIVAFQFSRELTDFFKITSFNNEIVDLFYIPPAVTLSLIILFGYKYIPLTFIPPLYNTISNGRPLLVILNLAIINPMIIGTAGIFLRKFGRTTPELISKQITRYLLIITSATIITALSSVLSFTLSGIFSWDEFIALAFDWWLGDIIALMTITPMILYFVVNFDSNYNFLDSKLFLNPPHFKKTDLSKFQDNLMFITPILLIILIIFAQVIFDPLRLDFNLFYLLFVPLSIIALYHGIKGSILGNFILIISLAFILSRSTHSTISVFNVQLLALGLTMMSSIIGGTSSDNYINNKRINFQKDRFSTIIEQASDAIVILNNQLIIEEVNKKMCDLVGIEKHMLVDVPFVNLLDSSDIQDFYNSLDLITDNVNFYLEINILHINQNPKSVEISGSKMDVDKFVLILRDITNRTKGQIRDREEQEHNYQSQKMDALGRLAGNIAHDFNNILTSIQNNAELLRIQNYQDSSGNGDIIKDILTASEKATQLTNQILSFSKRRVKENHVVNINNVINDITPLFKRLCGENIDLIIEKEEGNLTANISPTILEQIIINLIVNGVESIENFGTIRVETSKIETRSKTWVKLRIQDTGTGISAGSIENIFNPFYSTKLNGTGLGLSIVYNNTISNGGKIHVNSEKGVGTEFVIQFPHTNTRPEQIEEIQQDRPSGFDGLRVLIIEDDDLVHQSLKRLLRTENMEVYSAKTSKEAIKLAKDYDLELIISDIVLPDNYGPELVTKLSSVERGIPIIFMTGYTQSSKMNTDIIEQHYLMEKPFKEQELFHLINQILNGNSK